MDKLFVIILFVTFTSLDVLADQPPAVVEKYYNTMASMSEAQNDIEAVAYRKDLMYCFKGKEKGSIWVPNDFINWGYENELKKIPANTYFTRFYELCFKQKKLRMQKDYKILSSRNISEAELKELKNKNSNQYVQTVVLKTLSDGKITKTYSDTLLIDDGKIVAFKNAIYTEGNDVDIEALRALAASYYSTKQYDKAYQTYKQIINHDPQNSNAYYRLAILTYQGKGCEKDLKQAIKLAETAKSLRYTEDNKRLFYYLKTKQRI